MSGARPAFGRRSSRPTPTPFRTLHPFGFCASQTTRPIHAVRPHTGPRRPNITSIEKRRHRGETAEDEEGDATSNLLFKHPNKAFSIYIRKQLKHLQHTSETLIKTPKTLEKTIAKYMQHPDKTHATYV
jgi:hypothetical protein